MRAAGLYKILSYYKNEFEKWDQSEKSLKLENENENIILTLE